MVWKPPPSCCVRRRRDHGRGWWYAKSSWSRMQPAHAGSAIVLPGPAPMWSRQSKRAKLRHYRLSFCIRILVAFTSFRPSTTRATKSCSTLCLKRTMQTMARRSWSRTVLSALVPTIATSMPLRSTWSRAPAMTCCFGGPTIHQTTHPLPAQLPSLVRCALNCLASMPSSSAFRVLDRSRLNRRLDWGSGACPLSISIWSNIRT